VSVASAQQLIGTYTVNYRYNAAGCNGGGDFGPTEGNPYFCPGPFAPGPIFVSAPPGQYRIVDTTVSHMAVWVGNQAGGTRIEPGGGTVDLTVTTGQQIVLYYWDWYVYDNPDTDFTVVELYSLPGPAAPTKLNATQLLLDADTGIQTGTEIKLTWNYGSDLVDGFKVERQSTLEIRPGTQVFQPRVRVT
jgi:hypothetical protein